MREQNQYRGKDKHADNQDHLVSQIYTLLRNFYHISGAFYAILCNQATEWHPRGKDGRHGGITVTQVIDSSINAVETVIRIEGWD